MNTQEFIEGYENVLTSTAKILRDWEEKAEALVVLSDKIEQLRDEVPRNTLLEMRMTMDELKKASARTDKLVKASAKWVDSSILLRLTHEELDNYSYMGKMFYPSANTYFSVADRTALEAYMKETGRLDILGNTLNKEVTGDIAEESGSLPPGVNSYVTTRLNCRTK